MIISLMMELSYFQEGKDTVRYQCNFRKTHQEPEGCR